MRSADGILLSAGLGTRLRPLTVRIPKAAVPILDIPIGLYGLAALLRRSPRVFINTSHLSERLEATLRRWTDDDPRCSYFEEQPEPLGTAGTLAALRDRLADRVITYNADLLSDIDVDDLLRSHREIGLSATMAVRRVPEGADLTAESGRVERLIDRRREPGAAGIQFIGVAVLERSALELLNVDPPAGLGETLFPKLALEGQLAVHEHPGYALDVGSPERYVRANIDALAGRAPPAPAPHPGRSFDTDGGRAYVGPRAVAPLSTLRAGAVVLEGAHVFQGALIERSVVAPRATVPGGRVVSDRLWI